MIVQFNMKKVIIQYLLNCSLFIGPFIGELFPGSKFFVKACNSFSDYCDMLDETKNLPTSLDNSKVKINPLQPVNYDKLENRSIKSEYLRLKRSNNDNFKKAQKSSNRVSTLLDELLINSGYDKKMRPEVDGSPIQVTFT